MPAIGIIDTPMKTHKEKRVSTFKELREEAGLTVFKLAAEAEVSLSTINRMEYGTQAVTKRMANHVLHILSEHLGRKVTIQDISNLYIKE